MPDCRSRHRCAATSFRSGWLWGLVWGSLLIALRPGGAVELREFRMADHPEFTRLVFELDAHAEYQIEHEPGSRLLLVTLEATGEPHLGRSWGPWVKRAVVEPLLDIMRVRVELRDSDIRVREERLELPPRIVLDVRPAPPAPSPPGSSEFPVVAEPTPPSEVPPRAEAPLPGVPPVATEAARSPAPELPGDPVVSPPPPPGAGRDPLELSRSLPPDADPERVHDLRSIAAQLSDAEHLRAVQPAPEAESRGWLEGYGIYGALLAASLVGLFAWRAGGLGWVARLGASLQPRLSTPAGRGGQGAVKVPSPSARDAPKPLTDLEGVAPSAISEDSMLDPPLESHDSVSPEGALLVSDSQLSGTASVDSSHPEELESRVEALEFALERALEGRERLEAQLAAQGEELRVQRAALARTQRAVRALSRSRDLKPDVGALRG